MTQEALKLAEIIEHFDSNDESLPLELLKEISATLRALAQTQEPVVYQCPRCATSMQVDLTAKAALAQTQEPVAWTLADKVRQDLDRQFCPDAFMRIAVESIVKHHPPQRTWVDLTDEDKKQIKRKANYHWEMTTGEYAERIGQLTEAKLKELNT